ncbi:MAG: helix-turn-helix domain-containing protein [Candidatus Aenigmarchaeota archaeon]|nr:helix-turn-helix domain-containing protein [Candidatus Aenigmarchaeota archaeon]
MTISAEEINATLKKMGLSDNETKIYFTLLKQGSSKAGNLSKGSHINRTTTYDALKRLLEKGLISYVIKENRKWFEASPPERLAEYLKEKEEELEKIMPVLKKIHSAPKEKHNVTLYYGYKGVKTVFMDIIRDGKDNDVFGDEGQLSNRRPAFAKYFVRWQDKKNIKTRLVSGLKTPKKYSKGTTYKYLPLPTLSPVATNIYGNKIAIIIWTEPPEAIIIENKTSAESYKNYFEFLWSAAKPIKKTMLKLNN